jgi:uncharacterized protein
MRHRATSPLTLRKSAELFSTASPPPARNRESRCTPRLNDKAAGEDIRNDQTGTLECEGLLEENEWGRPLMTLDTLRREKTEIIRLAEMRGCHNVRVFGSVVYGENRPDSDVDFLVDLEPGRSLFDLAGLTADLRDLLGAEVDLATTKGLHPYIRDRVLAEAEPL